MNAIVCERLLCSSKNPTNGVYHSRRCKNEGFPQVTVLFGWSKLVPIAQHRLMISETRGNDKHPCLCHWADVWGKGATSLISLPLDFNAKVSGYTNACGAYTFLWHISLEPKPLHKTLHRQLAFVPRHIAAVAERLPAHPGTRIVRRSTSPAYSAAHLPIWQRSLQSFQL